jgi:predicted  nucleic acid-binding Zn-ribbon protein
VTEQTLDRCVICGETEPDRRLLSQCFGCGQRYHLNPYSNQPGKDCGDAVLGEEFGLFYYCETCLVDVNDEYRAATNSLPAPDAGAPNALPELPPRPTGDMPPGLPPRPARETRPRRFRRIDRA